MDVSKHDKVKGFVLYLPFQGDCQWKFLRISYKLKQEPSYEILVHDGTCWSLRLHHVCVHPLIL